MDARKREITLDDLMSLRSGLACDEDDEHSLGNEEVMQNQSTQPDWYRFALDLPMVREAGGTIGMYGSSDQNLVAGPSELPRTAGFQRCSTTTSADRYSSANTI